MTFTLAALVHEMLYRRRLHRDARALLELDDRMLDDIGICRDEAERLARTRFGTRAEMPCLTSGAYRPVLAVAAAG